MTTTTMLYGTAVLGTTLLLQGDIATAHKVVTVVWNSAVVTFLNVASTVYRWLKEY